MGLIARRAGLLSRGSRLRKTRSRWRRGARARARLRLVASRFAFPKDSSPRHCTIRLSAAAQVVDNVDPTPADNTTHSADYGHDAVTHVTTGGRVLQHIAADAARKRAAEQLSLP